MHFLLAAALLFGQATPKADSYVRQESSDKGIFSLETAASHLTAPGKPDVWLVGVAHIGDKAYYQQIQKLLNAQDQVLFEGVKPGKAKAAAAAAPKPAQTTVTAKPNKPIYQVLSDALGLDFQLTDINYAHPNWIDSDLTMDDLERMNAANPEGKKGMFSSLMQMLDPNSPQTKQIAAALQMLGPGTREALKLFMIQKLATADPNATMFDPATAEIILTARNKSVEDYFAKSVSAPTPPKSIAIFYGALHQPSLQETLMKDYGYTVSEKKWFKAASADKKKIDPTGESMLQMLQKQFDSVTSGAGKAKS